MPDVRHFRARIITLVAFALAGCLLACTPVERAEPVEKATVLPEPRALPNFVLTDDRGGELTRASLAGGWTLMFFGFTHCPDVCPLTLQTLAAARGQLQEQQHTKVPDILFVSVDPARDTRETIASYVAHFGDGVRGARGDLPALQALTRDLGIFFASEPSTDGSYNVSHSSVVLLINPAAELQALFSAPHDVSGFVHDLPIILARR